MYVWKLEYRIFMTLKWISHTLVRLSVITCNFDWSIKVIKCISRGLYYLLADVETLTVHFNPAMRLATCRTMGSKSSPPLRTNGIIKSPSLMDMGALMYLCSNTTRL